MEDLHSTNFTVLNQQHPLACHVRYPTLSSLLTWIHATMRQDTFDLDEVLSLAAPWDAAAAVLERFQRLEGEFVELEEKNCKHKLLSNKTQKTDGAAGILATQPTRQAQLVCGAGWRPGGAGRDGDERQVAAFGTLMAEVRGSSGGSGGGGQSSPTQPASTTKQCRPKENKRQANDAEAAEALALRQTPAIVVSALLHLYFSSSQ